jgi:hypothetical protein
MKNAYPLQQRCFVFCVTVAFDFGAHFTQFKETRLFFCFCPIPEGQSRSNKGYISYNDAKHKIKTVSQQSVGAFVDIRAHCITKTKHKPLILSRWYNLILEESNNCFILII